MGDDTDLLVLLLYHANPQSQSIFFKSEPKKGSKKRRTWDNKKVKKGLGDACRNICFPHSLLGCDTTSRWYGIGKGVAITKLISNDIYNRHADVFSKPDSSPEEIAAAGETALLIVYNGKTESLDRLR